VAPSPSGKDAKTALIDSKPDSSDEYDEYDEKAENDIIFDSIVNEVRIQIFTGNKEITYNKFQTDNGSIACPKDQEFCYTLWTKNKNGTVIMSQGCWSSADKVDSCKASKCLGESTMKSTDLKFCCCTGDHCNSEFSESLDVKTTMETTDSPDTAPEKSIFDSVIVWISFLLVAIIIMNILVFLMCRKKPKSEPEAAPLCSLNYRYII
jgi:hypothetical protein